MLRRNWIAATVLIILAACRPPAADEYVERVDLQQRGVGAHVLATDPDTENAGWASLDNGGRLLFGNGGEVPLLSLACINAGTADAAIVLTRYVEADPQAKALIALIGNSHIARLPVETRWNGRVWLWHGVWPASSPDLAVFTGNREVEATIPGAGSVLTKGSTLPGQLIGDCAMSEQTISERMPPPK